MHFMRPIGKYIAALLFLILMMASALHAGQSTTSVVKIFVTANPTDYYRPWQSLGIRGASGSGSIIKGNKILTNAHVIADQTFIQVRKDADPKKYTAKVLAMGHDCDLAILTVDDPQFFEGTSPLEFGGLPKLQDAVSVLGYPEGGDMLSITEGVVSRVEVTAYSQSNRKLLTVQIDAAINPGNSGGPVVQDGKFVGVAMQVYQAGQNIGYMIPVPIIEHFLNDLDDGKYDGFPVLGIDFNNTENTTLRNFYKIKNENGGILVTRVLPFSPAVDRLKEGDVVLEISGVPIGEDGTFAFRGKERLIMSHLITEKQIGEEIPLKVMREGKIKNISVTLKPFATLVPYPRYYKKPPYFIYGGMVFTVLTSDLLRSWGNEWWEKAPLDFNYYLLGSGRLNRQGRNDLVVILDVLSDDINAGYHEYGDDIIETVNGKKFNSFKEFVLLINEIKRKVKFTVIETEHKVQVILDNEKIDVVDQEIIKRNSIPSQFSNDVAEWLKK